jgi:hypothetical protein
MQDNIALRALREHDDFEDARPLVAVEGLSSPRVCAFLNQLVKRLGPEERYLEVGTFRGRTLLSAAYENLGKTCIGCDRFRFWGRFTGPGFLAKRALYENIQRYQSDSANIEFHPVSSRRLFAEQRVKGPIGVYFYDGDHSYESTFHGIVSAAPLLSERAVVLVDDWNDPVIRMATDDAFSRAELRELWRRELPGDHSERGWWNGLGVFFVERTQSTRVQTAL